MKTSVLQLPSPDRHGMTTQDQLDLLIEILNECEVPEKISITAKPNGDVTIIYEDMDQQDWMELAQP